MEEKEKKTYDFTAIPVTEVDGSVTKADLSKIVGNALYCTTTDIGMMDKAREIYHQGKIALTGPEAAYFAGLIARSEALVAPFKVALAAYIRRVTDKNVAK